MWLHAPGGKNEPFLAAIDSVAVFSFRTSAILLLLSFRVRVNLFRCPGSRRGAAPTDFGYGVRTLCFSEQHTTIMDEATNKEDTDEARKVRV